MYHSYSCPKKCINRNCKHVLTKDCVLGHLPFNAVSVQVMIKCSKCHDVFSVIQPIGVANDYYEELPTKDTSKTELTLHERFKFSKELAEDENALEQL